MSGPIVSSHLVFTAQEECHPSSVERVYPIASVTKTFTAALCLEPECRDSLDNPLIEVLSDFRVKEERATHEMTPRHALCHLSGLAPQTAAWVDNPQTRREFVFQMLPTFDFSSDWRDRHRYSNVMYAVLGLWLEERTGSTWEDLIDTRIRGPLGLESLKHLEPGWEKECPPPYVLEKGAPKRIPPFYSRKNHLIAPASELRMSIRDLARWGQYHLSLQPDDERWVPHCPVTENREFEAFGPLHYGLGWRLDTVNGKRRVWHTGQCSGYTTLLSLYPEEGKGLAAAVNCSDATKELHELDLKFLHTNQTL